MLVPKILKCSLLLLVSQIYISFCNPTGKLYYDDVKSLSAVEKNLLDSWTEESKQNIWELSGQFEGDIILSSNQRNGLIQTNSRWPNREIPYKFEASFTSQQQEYIAQSLKDFDTKTNIRTRRADSSDKDYVLITKSSSGCFSYVGRIGGPQILNLEGNTIGGGCLTHGTIIHEFLHALGFYHQQSSTERDDYVTIVWNNIHDNNKNNFEKHYSDVITNFNQKYDYESLMHYSAYAFAQNIFKKTIITKDKNAKIDQRVGFSKIDIIKLNEMYKSSARTNSQSFTSDLGLIFGLATIATIRFKCT